MLVLGCILLGVPVLSGLWVLLVSETHDMIFYAFLLRSLVFSFVKTCVSAINNSPTLVEFVSINPYYYC